MQGGSGHTVQWCSMKKVRGERRFCEVTCSINGWMEAYEAC